MQANQIITISAITAVGILTVAAIMPALFPPQEVYAPSSRRGIFCEFRPAQMTEAWLPTTQATIEQIGLHSNYVGLSPALTS